MIRKTNLRKTPIVLAIIITIFDVSLAQQPDETVTASRISHFIKIDRDISLEVVEWGGKGKPLVFLAGLGHTAHVFDDFAPRFIDKFRVLGITRRGFGSSTQAETGYCIDTLANDILIVLDSLRLEDVILVGHSLGGDELTKLASGHEDRFGALIYLDAAYARSTNRDSLKNYRLPEIQTLEPTPEKLQSPEAYRTYYERVNGVRMPLSEIREMYNWNEDGSFAGGITPGWIYTRILESLQDQVYDDITLPALAIYAVDYPIQELFLDFDEADSSDQALMTAYYMAGKKLNAMSRKRFRQQMQNGKAVELKGAGHSLYITHSDRVEKEMRSFLDSVQ